jgi:hypothetical protein
MSAQGSPLGLFERYLSLWVLLAILAGLGLGLAAPQAVGALAGLEYASVNLVVAVLIWAMIYPMMVGVDFASIKDIGRKPKGLVITLVINWLVKPFTMAGLAVLFFDHLYAGLMPRADAQEYIAGQILLGAYYSAAFHVYAQEAFEKPEQMRGKKIRVPDAPAWMVFFRAVGANPVPMALWATLILVFTLLGMVTLLVGLVVAVPWLAHASWHAYRDLVGPEGLAGPAG